jgi:hypothetical protein
MGEYWGEDMKKIIFLLIFLALVGIAEAANVSLTVSWQLSSSTIRPGGDTIIYLTTTNPGLDLNGVTLTATPGPNLKLTSGNKIEMGDMPATTSQQSSISVRADSVADSTVSYVYIEARYYYANSEYKRTFYVPVTIRRDPVLEIANIVFNDTARPGKTISLSFDVYNRGDVSARDVKIKLNSTSLFITPDSSGEEIISEIMPSESKNIRFLLTINPESSVGIESIPVIMSFYDSTKSNNYTDLKTIGIKVSGNADFVINIDSYSNFYFGREGTVKIYIANRGSAPADYISISAESDFGSKEFYIGSLDPDDSETIELPQTLAVATGSYPILLKMKYRDRFDNEYSFEKALDVTPTVAPLDFNFVILVVVALIVVYWMYRRRRKK